MVSDLFLSYSRADRPLAERFVSTATARGVNVWYDKDIGGGEDWREKIVEALGAAKALVILFSEHSNESRQLIKELAIADLIGKPVIPVLVSHCEPKGAYLYEMASRNWINIFPDPESRLEALIDNLMTQLNLRSGASETAPVAEIAEAPALQDARSIAALTLVSGPLGAAHGDMESPQNEMRRLAEGWFPIRMHDLYFLVPVAALVVWLSLFGAAEDKTTALGFGTIGSFLYMLVIGFRNATLNRSIFSSKSFASYLVILLIGFSPALLIVDPSGDKLSTIFGLIVISLIAATIANLMQVALRKLFQRKIFRKMIQTPLAS